MAYDLIKKFKSKLTLFKFYLKALIGEIYHRRLRIIISYEKCTGNFTLKNNPIYKSDLNSVKLSRDFLFSKKGKFKQNFLDVGGGDGKLTYLLGMIKGDKYFEPQYKKNKVLFESKFEYYGTDLIDRSIKTKKSFVIGDICDSEYLKNNNKFINFFDVVYSNNVFEHLHNPFIAMENIYKMLKVNGYLITVAPFAARYHQSPGDYFRYTHQGLEKIISDAGQYKTLITGYDTSKRRFNIQGKKIQDIVPLDSFGGWRENWDVINISMKIK